MFDSQDSIILRFNLEVALGMVAGGTNLGSFLAYHNMTTVAALPDDITLARED